MLTKTFYNNLNQPQSANDVLSTAEKFISSNPQYAWRPFGGNVANKAPITITRHSGRALIERLVNVFDSYSEKYVAEHPEAAAATSVKDLVQNYMGKNLGTMSNQSRLEFAKDIGTFQRHKIYHGRLAKFEEKKPNSLKDIEECISIIDKAQGMTPEEMIATGILSLHSSNKVGKDWLQGQYGQGGASSLSHCKATFIASRKHGTDDIGFTVVKKQLAGDEYPASLWMMLVDLETGLPVIINKDEVKTGAIECGTKITHFDYARKDVHDNSSSDGSPFHLVRRLLPSCEFPLYFDDKAPSKGKGSTRVLYGSSKGIEVKAVTGNAAERKKILYTTGRYWDAAIDDGFIDVQVTVLANKIKNNYEKQTQAEKDKKIPKVLKSIKEVSRVDDFFTKGRSSFITVNGQNQHEWDWRSKIFESFPLLKHNMIVEVSIDRLTVGQKDDLEVSTREAMKNGWLLDEIQEKVRIILESITQLRDLEDDFEKKASTNKVKDETGLAMLKNLGLFGQIGKGKVGDLVGAARTGKPSTNGLPRTKKTSKRVNPTEPTEWILEDNPTFIEFSHEGVLPIFINDKTQYAYINTDAKDYFDESITVKVNHSGCAVAVKSAPLKNGTFRITLDGSKCKVDDTGVITVTLTKRDGKTLTDRCVYDVRDSLPKKTKAKGNSGNASTLAQIPEPTVDFIGVHWIDSAQEAIITADKEGDLNTIAGHALYKNEYNSITIWYSKEYTYYRGCLKAAGGARIEAKFDNIIRKYLSAMAITDIVDQYNTKEPTTEINVDWNTAMKAACFIATEALKK